MIPRIWRLEIYQILIPVGKGCPDPFAPPSGGLGVQRLN